MNLHCYHQLPASYKSASRIAGLISEGWCERELYCAACESDRLERSAPNTKAIDFVCPRCSEAYQLKCGKGWNQSSILGAGYQAMRERARTDGFPDLVLMQYTPSWLVANLLLVPGIFITESVVKPRRALSPTARRAGWVGSTILIGKIPPDGRIPLVDAGTIIPRATVRSRMNAVRGLRDLSPELRGWALDVLGVVRQLRQKDFALSDVYAFEGDLQRLHPRNRNVRAKIRQQLQVLRDLGLIDFTARGHYRSA